MMILVLSFWIFFNTGLIYQVTGGRRCTTSDGNFCCAHFYENSEKKCIECNIGYTSENGTTCFKCPQPFYGFHCAYKCSCNDDQICDHQIGCLILKHTDSSRNEEEEIANAHTLTQSKVPETEDFDMGHTLPQSTKSLIEEVDITHTLPQSNVTVSEEVDIAHTLPQSNVSSSGTVYILERTVTVTDRSRTTKPSDENTGKEDADKVVFYASSVGLIVLAFFIGMLLKGVQNKYCSGQNVSEEKNDEIQHSAEELQEIYSYEAIDELQITDQNQGSIPPRLPVPRSFVQHKNDHRDLKADQNGIRKENHRYLNPYQPIQEANIYEHEYMPINAEVTTNKTDDDQLHPYNFLLKHDMSEDHEYNYLGNTSTKSELPESNEFQSIV
ncbi:uncharacterized protein [Mytilus edulis]|uniref:uncharacterized protein isoform X2 n=1 Tax=Mytilus edulis TaxID=6550 RepID=UPI0039EE02F1